MKLGEVCLLTNDVKKLSDFYKRLLETDNGSIKDNYNRNICLAFTVLNKYINNEAALCCAEGRLRIYSESCNAQKCRNLCSYIIYK